MKRAYFAFLAAAVLVLASTNISKGARPLAILPTNTEIVAGLKQALELGAVKSADQLSSLDGFFANAATKILLPPQAQKAEKTLRKVGLGRLADNAVLAMNRAAEDAAKQAKLIFVDAIKQMTITDALNILTGNKDAATQYFKRATTVALTAKFRPVIQTSLANVGETHIYTQLATQYNRIPFTFNKINPELDGYVTEKAIDGLFYQIALEELNIRQNFFARTTPLLQKVFGFFDKKG